jgi:hypothetical protein
MFNENIMKKIPKKEESVSLLNKFVSKYISKNEYNKNGYFDYVVYLKTNSLIGYEYIFENIFQSTNFKIHVCESTFNIYAKMPTIQSFLTLQANETPIHACIRENNKQIISKQAANGSNDHYYPCKIFENEILQKQNKKIKAVKIILSTVLYRESPKKENIFAQYHPPRNLLSTALYFYYRSVYRLCYSFHSSCEELNDYVNTIRPENLYAINLPDLNFETNKIFKKSFQNQFKKLLSKKSKNF